MAHNYNSFSNISFLHAIEDWNQLPSQSTNSLDFVQFASSWANYGLSSAEEYNGNFRISTSYR
jgi:hypothetical protein